MGDKNFLLKVHDSYRWTVAICDKEIFGKILIEGNRQLDVSGQFFSGKEMDKEEVKNEVWRCSLEDANFNIVGERSIKLAKELGLIDDSGVGLIQGIPFALVLV